MRSDWLKLKSGSDIRGEAIEHDGVKVQMTDELAETASLIGSRVKRLAQGKLMPASTCTGYYLTQNFAGLAALPPSPAQNIFAGRRKNV